MTASAQTKSLPFQNLRPGRIMIWTLLFIGGLIMVTPLAFMFSTSLKTAGQVYDLRLIRRSRHCRTMSPSLPMAALSAGS